MATNILTIGDHSFISLYNWALSNNTDNNVYTIFHYSKSHAKINNDDGLILVKLNDLLIKSNEKNKITKIDSLKYLKSSTINLDLIIIYCKSLEDYSETLAKLVDLDLLLPTKTKIIIENTGSIPLNNFVNLSLPENLQGNIDIYYSLNKVNFRPILDEQKNKISYELKTGNDNQIQLAHLINNNSNNKNFSYNKEMMKFMSKIFKPYQIDFVYVEDSSKAFNEIWKHSVYSIVIQPLMIIFELDSFKTLEKFILCKPLLKGLYNELIKIYSLQTNLEDGDLKNLKTYFKWLFAKEDSLISLDLIEFEYNFENSFDLNILYPILLADDLKIKIPYLEFLYSILQQFNNYRFNKSNNFISKHKYTSQLEQLTIKLGKLEEQLNSKVNVLAEKLQVSETDNGALNQRNENLNNENDSLKHQLEIQVSDLQKRLQEEEMLKNDFLEQLTKLKINQTNRKSYTAVVGAVASGATGGNSATNTYMSSGDDEDYVDARESIARKSQLIQTTNLESNNDDFNEPTTPVVENLKNSRSIQGVNAQFSSPRSNTEAGLKALKDIQLFSEYAIYYGSPDKPATTTPTNGTNSTDTAVNEKDTSMEPQYDSKDGEEGEDYDDNTIENDNDVSMESLKQKQLELQKRELLLEQRERMFMGGNGGSMIHPPPPPKQQFPPIPRKASVGTFNKQIQLPTAMRMSYMQQQQGPVYDVNGNIIMQNSAPITPTGNAPFNPNYQQKPYIQKQQQPLQQQQQMYFPPPGSNQQYNIVPPQIQGRSVSQPITGSGHRILSNGSGNQLYMQQQQQQQQQAVPQAHHPQYIKTSRKNRSSVMIPSASKMNQNLNYDILNVNTQNSSEVLPIQTTQAFDDFGPYNNNPNMHRNSSVGQEGYMPMMMNNGSQRALKTKPSFHSISKKPSFHNINGGSGSNILPPGFTNTADLGNGNGSSTSLATHSISPQTGVGGGANIKTVNGSSTALTGNIIEEDENAKSVLEALSIKHEREHEQEKEEEKEYFNNDVNSDEFKLNTIKSEVKDKLDELASVADVKHEDINNKKHKKLSKLFGRRKASD
ncbi:hypothetical protein ACO0SA_004368 [Hanseniaspora valbyensis]